MKRLILILASIFLCLDEGICQTELDALRYSQINFGGTARYTGMGGAFGALGGDQSTLSVNPAGLGFFRKSEITLSPSLNASLTSGEWNGLKNNNARENFHIDNFGYIGSIEIDRQNWFNLNFGIVCNRFNTYSRKFNVTNPSSSTSLLDQFADQANGIHPTELEEMAHFTSNLAFEAYLLDPDTITWAYTVPLFENTRMSQDKRVIQRGRHTETDLSAGANYNDRIYLGVTLGFPGVTYREETRHTESPNPDTLELRSFRYSENLLTEGDGFNAKFGVIARATDFLRFGLAVHSPTWYNLQDTYIAQMQSEFGAGEAYKISSDEGNFRYKITTPSRYIGSGAIIIQKKGLISFDVEYVDYSLAKIKARGNFGENEFSYENNFISNNYKPAINLRVGAEARLNKLSFRGGYGLYGSPFKEDESFMDGSQPHYSAGLGYRDNNFFVDLAFTMSNKEEEYFTYSPDYTTPATVKTTTSRATATVGIRF